MNDLFSKARVVHAPPLKRTPRRPKIGAGLDICSFCDQRHSPMLPCRCKHGCYAYICAVCEREERK